jgi:hypothetical protein
MRIRAHTIRTSQFDNDFDLELSDAAYDFAENIPEAPAPRPEEPIPGWPVDEMGNPFRPVVGMSYSWNLTPGAPQDTLTRGKLKSYDDQGLVFAWMHWTERLSPHWIDAITAHEENEANPWKTLAELGEPEKGVEYELRLRGNPTFQWAPTGNIVAEYEGRLMGGGPGTRMIFRRRTTVRPGAPRQGSNPIGVEENNLLFIRPQGSATPAVSSSPENTLRQDNAVRRAARTLYEGFVNSPRGGRSLERAMELRYPDQGDRESIENVVAFVAEAAAQWFYNDTQDEESMIAGARGWDAISDDFIALIREDLSADDRSRRAQTLQKSKLLKEAMSLKDITATSFALKSFLTLPRGLKDSISIEDWLTSHKGSLHTAQRLATAFGRIGPKALTSHDLKAL